MSERTALDEKADNIQRDVADLAAECQPEFQRIDDKFHRIDEKFERIDEKVDTKVGELSTGLSALNASLAEHRIETEKSFGKLREADGELRREMIAGFAALRLELRDAIERLRRDRLGQIGWMVTTAITAVGVAFTVARFFVPRMP